MEPPLYLFEETGAYCTCAKIHVRKIMELLCTIDAATVQDLISGTTALRSASSVQCRQDQHPVIGKLARPGTAHLPRSAPMLLHLCNNLLVRKHPVTTYTTVDCLRAHIRHISRIPDPHLALLPSQRPRATFSSVISKHHNDIPSAYTPATIPSAPLWCLDQLQVNLKTLGIKKKTDHSNIALKQAALLLLHETHADRREMH